MEERRSLHELLDRIAPERLPEVRQLLRGYVNREPAQSEPLSGANDPDDGQELLREEC